MRARSSVGAVLRGQMTKATAVMSLQVTSLRPDTLARYYPLIFHIISGMLMLFLFGHIGVLRCTKGIHRS